ncbi:MAG: glycosyltransferase [Acidiferrobacteraceae bacterium]
MEHSIVEHRSLRCSILAVGDFPDGGASSQRLYLLARILCEGLGDTSVWLLHAGSKVSIPENTSLAGEREGVKFVYLSGTTIRPARIGAAILDTLRGIYRSARLLMRADACPDVLILYTPTLLKFIVPVAMAKLRRIPIIVEACEIFSKSTDTIGVGFLRRAGNSGQLLMERWTPALAAGLLVISQRIQKYYEKLGLPPSGSYLLPVLIDFKRYEKGGTVAVNELIGVKFLLNSGSFGEKDGLAYFVSAVARIREDDPALKLVFTGTAPTSTRAMILAGAGAGAEDWIIFTGLISREALIWCYKNAAGLLCCRSNSDYANYGFPTKLAEYLASGRPVVATTVGDVTHYLTDEETAFLAEPENIESIDQAIRRLLRDPRHSALVGVRGTEVAKHYFDYRNYVAGISAFIRQKIGREHPG